MPGLVFWLQVFSYITKNNLPPFDVLFYVLSSPPLLGAGNQLIKTQLKKLVEKDWWMGGYAGILLPAMVLCERAFESWVKTGRIPPKYRGVLQNLSSLILLEYKKIEGRYKEEDIWSEEDLALPYVQPRSWFVIKSIPETKIQIR